MGASRLLSRNIADEPADELLKLRSAAVARARAQAIKGLERQAVAVGANAVLGVAFETEQLDLDGPVVVVTAHGTACVVVRAPDAATRAGAPRTSDVAATLRAGALVAGVLAAGTEEG